jgi:hypothetical protein
MTKTEALAYFKEHILPEVDKQYPPDKRGRPDGPARREAWSNYTDSLQREGQITQKQCDTWIGPFK